MKMTTEQIKTYNEMEQTVQATAEKLDDLAYDDYQAGINLAHDLYIRLGAWLAALPIAREEA